MVIEKLREKIKSVINILVIPGIISCAKMIFKFIISVSTVQTTPHTGFKYSSFILQHIFLTVCRR